MFDMGQPVYRETHTGRDQAEANLSAVKIGGLECHEERTTRQKKKASWYNLHKSSPWYSLSVSLINIS
jgi:hypothetical protein